MIGDGTAVTGPIYGTAGYTDSGLAADLFVQGDLDSDQTACFSKWLDHIFDHDANQYAGLQGNPGNSAIHERAFDGTDVALVTTATGEGALLAAELYPDGVPSDVQLVAFGIGPSNDAVGTTMQMAPLDPRVDNSKVYGRFIAVFASYSPRAGRRAELKAVINAKGRTQNNALSEFWQSTNPE